MSLRLLQSSSGILLLMMLLIISITGFQYSREVTNHLELIVDTHNPVLEHFKEVNHNLDLAKRRLLIFQHQFNINPHALRDLGSQIVQLSATIEASLPLRSDSPEILKKSQELLSFVLLFNSHNKNKSLSTDIERVSYDLKTQISLIYSTYSINTDNPVHNDLKLINNHVSEIVTQLHHYTQQATIVTDEIVQPLDDMPEIIDEIIRHVGLAINAHNKHNHVESAVDSGAPSKTGSYNNFINRLVLLNNSISRLKQSIIIYTEEKSRMDPSAAQVIDALNLVNQLLSDFEHELNHSEHTFKNFIDDEHKQLQIDTQHEQRLFFIAMLCGAIFSLVAITYTNKLISRDVAILNHTTLDFADDLDARISGTRLGEFRQLSTSINFMLTQLSEDDKKIRDNIRQLDSANNNLETQVALRTEELRQSMDAARKSDKAKSEFLANMSHELRTPLHGIISFASFGLEKTGTVSDEKLLKYFSQIDASAHRLKVLLDDLLDLSKLEAGKMVMSYGHHSITEIIEQCISEQEAALATRNLTIRYQQEDSLPLVYCDSNRIGQVVMNILNNSLKFSPDDSVINVSVTHIENSMPDIQVAIADQGPGIPSGEMESIFDKFMQSKQHEYSSGGTGLGLAISRELIDANGGHIWCENQPQGGAVFYFTLNSSSQFSLQLA